MIGLDPEIKSIETFESLTPGSLESRLDLLEMDRVGEPVGTYLGVKGAERGDESISSSSYLHFPCSIDSVGYVLKCLTQSTSDYTKYPYRLTQTPTVKPHHPIQPSSRDLKKKKHLNLQ